MKLKKITKIQIIGCIIGLSLLLYPTFSNYWNSKHATQAINNYLDSLVELDDESYKKILNDANEYNRKLLDRSNNFTLTDELENEYYNVLNIDSNGIMGYIEIDKIGVALPIYHGTSNEVLQSAIGHIEWSSLPVGGIATHSVVSGHRGLPNMKLFTDLDDLNIGDVFSISILKETLYYEVDQILVVKPEETNSLVIDENNDYVTLVTCTPYGINTHRLLVRGHRVEGKTPVAKVISEAVIIDQVIVATLLAIPFLLILVLIVLFKKPVGKEQK